MAGTSSTRAKNKYAAKNYDRVSLMIPKGCKQMLQSAADQHTKGSMNSYITQAINERLNKDGFEPMQKQMEQEQEHSDDSMAEQTE